MVDQQIDIAELLKCRLAVAKGILHERLAKPPFTTIDGVEKLKNRLTSEIRFLETIESGKQPLEKKFVETSNIMHFENIVNKAEKYEGVTAVLQTFTIKNVEDGDRTMKHIVDIVANNGNRWIKVISRSPKGICMDWLTGASRNILEQANDYIQMSKRFMRNFSAPEVVFDFTAGVPDRIANKLRSEGVNVVGTLVDINTITKVPEDFLEMLDVSETKDVETSSSEPYQPPINLDVSAVFVLVSNLTHEGGTNHRFSSKLLTQQAEMEREQPARRNLLEKIEGRDWIMCKTAFEAVKTIVYTVGGETERERWEELIRKVRIVEDNPSPKSELLQLSDRINSRSIVIFGSGDHYKAVTATANKHFVSSAHHQGVAFDVVLHESRALSEQKEQEL
ncbi:unnamed protein product [Caenorhabditis auriculariae]|uniref:DUF1308 domain-containing protein n=1 Tax=Caenorhabditis auriculariae TaxID=2777116 RepID=A0A8S1HCZ9_9PELO|nr:unnamed protein product [Caenorhabditis auriculariae]